MSQKCEVFVFYWSDQTMVLLKIMRSISLRRVLTALVASSLSIIVISRSFQKSSLLDHSIVTSCRGKLACSQVDNRPTVGINPVKLQSPALSPGKNLSVTQLQPARFALIPSAEERPLKPKAVMTLLVSASAEEGSMDFYSISGILHAFLFNHYPATKFTAAEAKDTEFVVMVTHMVPPVVRNALLDAGARLIVVPILLLKDYVPINPRYQYIMTKLRLFQLEGIYSSILFIDADVFYLQSNPTRRLWKYLDAHEADPKTSNTTFFGASLDPCNPTINSGMILLRPSTADYNEMIRLAPTPPYNEFTDQSIIHHYFKNVKGKIHFPQKYNVMAFDLCKKNIKARPLLYATLGYHYKFWESEEEQGFLFHLWQRPMAALRQWQVERGVSTALVPVVPENVVEWIPVYQGGAMMYRVALFSLERGRGKTGELSRRDSLARRYAQAVHMRQGDIPLETCRSPVALLEALRFAASFLLAQYDWVFVLDHRAEVEETALVHAHMETIATSSATLGVYRDCYDEKTAGFWIGRKVLPQINQVVADLDRIWYKQQGGAYSPELTDFVVWETLIQTFANANTLIEGGFHTVDEEVCADLFDWTFT